MKHLKLWICIILAFLVLVAAIVFGRGWVRIGTKWEPGGEFDWGPKVDGVKFDEDMAKLQRAFGLKKDMQPPPLSPTAPAK
jgi:hypothetical protein